MNIESDPGNWSRKHEPKAGGAGSSRMGGGGKANKRQQGYITDAGAIRASLQGGATGGVGGVAFVKSGSMSGGRNVDDVGVTAVPGRNALGGMRIVHDKCIKLTPQHLHVAYIWYLKQRDAEGIGREP